MDPAQFLAAVRGHAWPIVAAFVVGAIVRLVKSDKVPVNVPSRWRPLLALALGVLSGAAEAVIAGTQWPDALLGGVISALVASGGHEVIIEAIRGGREVGAPPAPPAAMVLLLVLAPTLHGCGASMKDAAAALNAANTIATAAEPCLVSQRAALLAQCGGDATCEAAVREKFSALADAYDVLHGAWCVLVPDAEGCAR